MILNKHPCLTKVMFASNWPRYRLKQNFNFKYTLYDLRYVLPKELNYIAVPENMVMIVMHKATLSPVR